MQQMAKQWERKPKECLCLEVSAEFSKHLLHIAQRLPNTLCSEKKKKKGSKTSFNVLAFFSSPDVAILLLVFWKIPSCFQ